MEEAPGLVTRRATVAYINAVVTSTLSGVTVSCPRSLSVPGDWRIRVIRYAYGLVAGEAESQGNGFGPVLASAVRGAIGKRLSADELARSRFKVVTLDPSRYAFVVYGDDAFEVVEDVVVWRTLTKEHVRACIEASKQYLFRVLDPVTHGARKYYDSASDQFEPRAYSIYTASVLFSLMRLYDYDRDEKILSHLDLSARFLLEMQHLESGPAFGAFHYSRYLVTGELEMRFVAGTTAKSIFTLLMLYERTGQARYLEAAGRGGDWLLSRIGKDGSTKPVLRYVEGSWRSSKRLSFLYTGQMLSALSRLYRVSGEERYLESGRLLAEFVIARVAAEGDYLGDDYRAPNPISSSWVILSLFDFFLASGDRFYLDIVLNNSEALLERQLRDERSILSFGRWHASETTSGNGWINEVFSDLYHYRKEHDLGGLEEIRRALARVTRYGIQNTYNRANSYLVRNPDRAIGGAYWNAQNRYVRTDSVCHAVNAYVAMVDEYEDEVLVTVARQDESLFEFLDRRSAG
jgi:hypothetical protein